MVQTCSVKMTKYAQKYTNVCIKKIEPKKNKINISFF